MKTLSTKQFILMITIIFAGLTSTIVIAESCPNNTQDKPVNFIYVVLDKDSNGLPINVAVSPHIPISGRIKNIKRIKLDDHDVKQKETICWRAIVKISENPEVFKFTHQKIAVLWQPEKNIQFKYIVKEVVPENSPVGIVYKYTIATEKSDPKNSKTYLDPRIVIKKKI